MSSLTLNPTNTVALVTGASRTRGIGQAIATALIAAGAKRVYVTARQASQLDSLAKQHPGVIVPLALDVTDAKAIAALPKLASDVTLVVNNAGTFSSTGALTGDLADTEREFAVNFYAPLRIVRAFAPVLKANGGGAVVNINSIASLLSFPLAPTYSASKAAAHSVTMAQRRELASQKTLVVGVYPGPIDTDMGENVPMAKAPASQVADAILKALRSGQEDVFPDATSVELSTQVQKDAKAVERQFAAMTAAAAAG